MSGSHGYINKQVNGTFNRNECGSVHIQTASISLTFDSPGILRKHAASSSLDSSCTLDHGGKRKRAQERHE